MSWETLPTSSEIVAIHAALLPTSDEGDILCFGDWAAPGPTTHARLFHVGPGTVEAFATGDLATTNAFCAGQSFLADGRLLVGGGTASWPAVKPEDPLPPGKPHGHHYAGERHCWLYLPRAKKWVPAGSFNFQPGSTSIGGGRWYPTLVTLGNGHVFATAGHPDTSDTHLSRHNNNTPERYAPATNAWVLLGGDLTAPSSLDTDSYPRFHVLPNGLLFSDTAGNGPKRTFDPWSGTWVGPDVDATAVDQPFYGRGSAATSVLLPLLPPLYAPRVLMCNGTQAFRIDVDASPTWFLTTARTGAAAGTVRSHACAVLLPTGTVLVTGGVGPPAAPNGPATPVFAPELYDPGFLSGTESWTTLPDAATVARGYHSVALLLPDGRVWTAGSTEGGLDVAETEMEVYSPDYVDVAGRPEITAAPENVGYGAEFYVSTPQAGSIQNVALLRCGSVTHAFDADQRYVGLDFDVVGEALRVKAPPNGNVAPPGWYMLWIVDEQGRPCQRAAFVRVSSQRCTVYSDVSTFSRHHVAAVGVPNAVFTSAFYVVYEGFLPTEVAAPTVTLRRPDNTQPPGMALQLDSVWYEVGQGATDVAQRIVYAYNVVFNSMQSFDEMPSDDPQAITVTATMQLVECGTTLSLSKTPNPFMRDGDPPWLSIDLRVFCEPDPPAASSSYPFDRIKSLVAAYDLLPQPGHPFDQLPRWESHLALYSHDDLNRPVHNYAVARVRYKAPVAVDADDVRVFFRLCTTGWTGLEYDTGQSYARAGTGPNAAPLLGLVGGAVNTVPCFAEPRVGDMTTQSDLTNRKDFTGLGNQDVYRYFGCVLDTNDDIARFPEKPVGNGPFTGPGLKSVRGLLRGLHHCLVAELYWAADPTPAKATPGTSDNLAQRNIIFDESDNPGSGATHLVQHTFEIKPSTTAPAETGASGAGGVVVMAAPLDDTPRLNRALEPTFAAGTRSDELMIDWGNLPRDAHVTFFLPDVDIDALLALAGLRSGAGALARAGEGAVRCTVGDVSFLPVPGGRDTAIPCLLTVQLPPGVVSGQRFSIVVRQLDGWTRRVIGTFQFDIAVSSSEAIVPRLRRNYSVLQHIALGIPAEDRWHPVFVQWLAQLADKLRAFGEDPGAIGPSSTGDGRATTPRPPRPHGERPEHPHGEHTEHPRAAGESTGAVTQLVYDCHGRFEGFVLDSCGEAHEFRTNDAGLEEVVRRACAQHSTITVVTDERGRPVQVVVHC